MLRYNATKGFTIFGKTYQEKPPLASLLFDFFLSEKYTLMYL